MAKKTLEAKLRMVDETQAATRSAAAGARAVTSEYEKLDKAMRQAVRRTTEDRRVADRTIERQRISNLEREVRLGREGAAVELEKARATAAYRREREALLAVMKNETSTVRQKAAAEQELMRLNALHLRGQAGVTGGAGAGPGMARQLLWRGAGLAAGMVGVRTAGEVFGNVRRAGDDAVGFETHMKDLLTVGDNSGKIDQVRQKVLNLSAATGRAREDIANLLFFIETGTAGMSGSEKGDIERTVLKMGRTTTTPLDVMSEAMIKGWRQFGGELKNVDELADKFFMTVERGFLTHGDMARYITQVLSSGDAFKFKLDELLAVTAVGTKGAADAQTAMTSIRNIILQLNKAEEEGIHLTGGLIDQLQQISQLDSQKLADMFGKRNVTVLFDLVKRTQELRSEMEGIGHAAGTVDKRLADLAKNGTHAMATMLAGFKEAQKNALLGVGTDPGTMAVMTDFEAARMSSNQGWAAVLPEWMKDARAAARTGADASVEGYIQRAADLAEADDMNGAMAALARADKLRPNADQAREIKSVRSTLEGRGRIRENMDAAERAKRDREYVARQRELKSAVSTEDDWFWSGRTTKTQKRWMDMLAGDKDGSVAKGAAAIVAAGNKTGRSFDEQAAIAEGLSKMVTGAMRSAFGDKATTESMRKEMAAVTESLFGRRASMWEKLMGQRDRPSTALPVIGEALRGGAERLLGPRNAAFLGLADGTNRGREFWDPGRSRDFEHLKRDTGELWSEGSALFQDLAGRGKVEAEMRRSFTEIEKNTKTSAEAMEIMKKIWGNLQVLNLTGI